MKFWKDKEGKKITFKEFLGRWKEGIEGITPKQKLKSQSSGTTLQLIGIVLGIVISIMNFKMLWWVGIILVGALITTGTTYLTIKQQLMALKKFEENITEEVSLDDFFEDKKDGTKTKKQIKNTKKKKV